MLAGQLAKSEYFNLFWEVLEDGPINANRVARVFVQDARAAQRRGGRPDRISREAWRKLFSHLRAGELHWEALSALVRQRSKRAGADWMHIAAKQQMLPLSEKAWQPMLDAALQLRPRSRSREARIRWLMGQLQRPPGRIPAQHFVRMLEERTGKS